MTTPYKKKLIEVALPLEDINREAAREKSIRHGHPSTLHLWWARRPLAACRAVLFASLVDDPSEHVEELLADAGKRRAAEKELKARRKVWGERKAEFDKARDAGMNPPSPGPEPRLEEIVAEIDRERIFDIIRELVKWENSNNERVLGAARAEILKSTNGSPPPVYDPFCGGGSIPLEAQRLGLEAHASDLNPVPVLITKALIEIPPRFAGRPPVHPLSADYADNTAAERKSAVKSVSAVANQTGSWKGAAGPAEDIRYYGQWMRDEAEKRIGHLYPKVKLPKEHGGGDATVIAWLWARTVKCPNPACRADAPLVKSFWVSKRKGKEVFALPILDRERRKVRFEIRTAGEPPRHTSDRTGGRCLFCDLHINKAQLRELASRDGLGVIPFVVVADGPMGRVFLPSDSVEEIQVERPVVGFLQQPITNDKRWFSPPLYGLTLFADLFTSRQLIALSTFQKLIAEVRDLVRLDAGKALNSAGDTASLASGGTGASAYADAVAIYLAFAVDKMTDTNTTLCTWQVDPPRLRATFGRQALPMSWDFAEANIFADAAGDYQRCVGSLCEVLERLVVGKPGSVVQAEASSGLKRIGQPLISTDPPYYDNIGYADLSDFFYVWLRGTLGDFSFPGLFGTMLVPKSEELIASAFRFGGSRAKAQEFFEQRLGKAFRLMRELGSADFPLTVYYAFKQSESESSDADDDSTTDRAIASTGWETMLEGLLHAGFSVNGTWPMRSELATRNVGRETNALASSIVLVCRPRPKDAGVASRRDFLAALKRELPEALRNLQKGNIAPVDLAQAAIGPGMAVFSRYSKVLESDGSALPVRTALGLINRTLDDVLAEQEGEFEPDTRWALAWFDQHGFAEGPYGTAEVLCTAKATSMKGMEEAGILVSKGGKVRLLHKEELLADWDPATDDRFTTWEGTHYLCRALEAGGVEEAAQLVARLGSARAETARDLAYRLYSVCERRKWAQDAITYNNLVIAWPEITQAGGKLAEAGPTQQGLGL